MLRKLEKTEVFLYIEGSTLRKLEKLTAFLYIEPGYVKKVRNNEGLPSHRGRLR